MTATTTTNPAAEAAPAAPKHKISKTYYPIVYVRGYAMTAAEREQVFNDGYYGFAVTSVEKRQAPPPRHFEADVFEGLLIRLIKDHNYVDAFNRGLKGKNADPTRSIWVSRFYDPDYFKEEIRNIEDHSEDLRKLVCDDIPARLEERGVDTSNYKVILLAHSMGGLVCRTFMQTILPSRKIDPKSVVHRLVTMGTPHRGIDLGSIPDALEDRVVSILNPFDSKIFKEERMRRYLDLGPDYDIHSLGPEDRFPVKRCLCIIGSDWQSYGEVRKLTGGVSDGLVKQDRAYVVSGPKRASGYDDAHRAFWANVHRAHSGYRGIVNSYETYENIQRFLFGDIIVRLDLENIEIRTWRESGSTYFYDLNFALAIRGSSSFLHRREQTPCENAIRIEVKEGERPQEKVFLHTGFMDSKLRDEGNPYSHFLIRFRVTEHRVKKGFFWDDEYPGRVIYSEDMEVRVGDETVDYVVEYRWLSDVDSTPDGGWAKMDPSGGTYRVPLRCAKSFGAVLVVRYSPWPDVDMTQDVDVPISV